MDEEVKIVIRSFPGSSVGRLYVVRSNGESYPIENWYDAIIVEGLKVRPDNE